jgi:8-oxo-dGTP pyrophosphatase MutT (NUDIX family)
MLRWTVHSQETLYRDRWVHLLTADVELPDGRHLDHRVIRTAAPGAGLVVVNEDDHVLMIWRHRFITDTWAWEIPLGSINDGEKPADAAVRETEEETGWRATGPVEPLLYVQPTPGLMTSEHNIFQANGAVYTGPPTDDFESDKVDWLSLGDVPSLIRDRQIVAGTTLSALLFVLATRNS